MEKELFFKVRKKVPLATKPAKGLSGRATKKRTFFCGFPELGDIYQYECIHSLQYSFMSEIASTLVYKCRNRFYFSVQM